MSNEVNKKLEFMRNHDGSQTELSEAEKLVAAELFKTLCYDLVLANLDRSYSEETTETCVDFTLTANDGSYLDITITQKTEGNSGATSLCLMSLTENSVDDVLENDFYYLTNRSGSEVIRHDNLSNDEQTLGELISVRHLSNSYLEQQMGVNDQPVGVEEINQLRAIVEASVPVTNK